MNDFPEDCLPECRYVGDGIGGVTVHAPGCPNGAPPLDVEAATREHIRADAVRVARMLATDRPLFTAKEVVELMVAAMGAAQTTGAGIDWEQQDWRGWSRSTVARVVEHKDGVTGHELADGAVEMAELLRDAEHDLSPALGFLRLDLTSLEPGKITEAIRAEQEARGDWYGGTVDAVCRFMEGYAAELHDRLSTVEQRMDKALKHGVRAGTEVAGRLGIDPFKHAFQRHRAQKDAEKAVDGDG